MEMQQMTELLLKEIRTNQAKMDADRKTDQMKAEANRKKEKEEMEASRKKDKQEMRETKLSCWRQWSLTERSGESAKKDC
jgi:hypothetical protein